MGILGNVIAPTYLIKLLTNPIAKTIITQLALGFGCSIVADKVVNFLKKRYQGGTK